MKANIDIFSTDPVERKETKHFLIKKIYHLYDARMQQENGVLGVTQKIKDLERFEQICTFGATMGETLVGSLEYNNGKLNDCLTQIDGLSSEIIICENLLAQLITCSAQYNED